MPSIPFRSAAELLESPYQMTILRDTAYHDKLEHAVSGTLKTIWNKKFLDKELSLKNTTEDLITAVESGYALCHSNIMVQSMEAYKDCSITDTGYSLFHFDNAFAFSKDFPFKDLFNHAMMKMIESGELQKIKTKYQEKKPNCDGSSRRSLGFGNVGFAFAVFGIGIFSSIIIMIIENLRKKLTSCKTIVKIQQRKNQSENYIVPYDQ